MSRAITFLALLAVLTLRFVDGAAHAHVHEHQSPVQAVLVVLDQDDDCGNNDLHAAAHCASHMADTMQRSQGMPISRAESSLDAAPLGGSALHDGRILSPPVRPPLA